MKKVVCLLLALSLLFIAACSGNPSATTSQPPQTGGSPDPSGEAPPPVDEGPAVGPDGQKYGGILRIIGGNDTSTPWGIPWHHNAGGQGLLAPWSESMLICHANGSYTEWLAESFEIDVENAQLRFVLKEGIYFHDGSELNAEVTVWNINQAREEGNMNPAIIGAEATGEYTLTVFLDDYYNGALDVFASHAFSIISKKNYDENGAEYAADNPVGTGPFIFTERIPGSRAVFVRNENYWREGLPYLDGLEYVEITDIMTQIGAMQSTGEDGGDILGISSAEQVALLQSSGAPVYVDKNPMGPVCLFPSSMDENSPLSKLEVRQAIAYAIDRETICEARGFGILTPATQFISEPFLGPLPDSYNLSYDQAKARELLDEAGYPDGFTTNLIMMPGMDRDAIVAIQDMLSEVGITCELQFPESGAATELRKDWDGLLVALARSLPNMTTTFRLFLDPDYQYYPQMWRPVDEMRPVYITARSTEEVENENIQEFHRLVLDNMVLIPIYYTYDTFIHKNNVHDTQFTAYGPATFWMPGEAWKGEPLG